MITQVPDVSVVVPVYEEEGSLPQLTREIRAVCERSGYSFEVWLIDDGSQDRSWEIIERLHEEDPRFVGIRFRRNYGKSAALAVGFQHARGRYVITMDADLQDDPEEIPNLVAALEEGEGYDLVSGWKQKRHDPLEKRVPSKFFNYVTRQMSGIPLHDFNCGLKGYRNEVVKQVKVYGELHRFIPLLAKWEGYGRITERVVHHRPRVHGRTKFGIERYLRGFLDLISVVFLTRFAARPMHFFGTLGTLCFIGGFLVSLWITIDKLVLGHPIGDRPLLLFGVLLILLGAQMFSVGLLGEMFIRKDMERTSAYQIREMLVPEEPVADGVGATARARSGV